MSTPSEPRRLGRLVAPLLGVALVIAALAVALINRTGDDSRTVTVTDTGKRTVAVHLADMRIDPARIAVPVGTHLLLRVTNIDEMRHDLYIQGGPRTPLLGTDQSATLDLGTVTHDLQGWCTVPGHKAAGMTMSITAADISPSTHDGMAATMPGMAASGPARPAARINPAAMPGPQWTPYDPALTPAPGSTVHRATLTIRDVRSEVAPGVRQTFWTYNGTAPGPILHGRVGDLFVIKIVNHGHMAHGIDFHAGSVDPDGPMRAVQPGHALTYRFRANYSGAWLYHCSTMPMSLHIDQYDHAPIHLRAGERIRVWVVDAGPQFSLPAPGHYPFLDHAMVDAEHGAEGLFVAS